jgi:hypothetical protein
MAVPVASSGGVITAFPRGGGREPVGPPPTLRVLVASCAVGVGRLLLCGTARGSDEKAQRRFILWRLEGAVTIPPPSARPVAVPGGNRGVFRNLG